MYLFLHYYKFVTTAWLWQVLGGGIKYLCLICDGKAPQSICYLNNCYHEIHREMIVKCNKYTNNNIELMFIDLDSLQIILDNNVNIYLTGSK